MMKTPVLYKQYGKYKKGETLICDENRYETLEKLGYFKEDHDDAIDVNSVESSWWKNG